MINDKNKTKTKYSGKCYFYIDDVNAGTPFPLLRLSV